MMGQAEEMLRKDTRDYSLDWMRLFSCICVICIHVSNVYSRNYKNLEWESYAFSVAVNTAARVSVPLFFMISGALLIPKKVDAEKYKKRIVKYGLLLVLWSVIYYLFNHYYMGPDYELYEFDIKNIFYSPVESHLWFLFAILTVYVILPVMQVVCKEAPVELMKKLLIIWLAVTFCITVLDIHEMKIRYQVTGWSNTYYIGYFIAGYFIRRLLEKQVLPNNCLIWAGAIGGFVVTAGLTLWDTSRSHVHIEDYFHYRSVFIAISAMGIFAYCLNKLKKVSMNRWFERATNCSFGIYLVHVIFLNIIREETSFFSYPSILGIPLIVSVIFTASYATVYLLKKIPFVNAIV